MANQPHGNFTVAFTEGGSMTVSWGYDAHFGKPFAQLKMTDIDEDMIEMTVNINDLDLLSHFMRIACYRLSPEKPEDMEQGVARDL